MRQTPLGQANDFPDKFKHFKSVALDAGKYNRSDNAFCNVTGSNEDTKVTNEFNEHLISHRKLSKSKLKERLTFFMQVLHVIN